MLLLSSLIIMLPIWRCYFLIAHWRSLKQTPIAILIYKILGFTSFQHLRSYQGGYWLVTVSTHADFIVRSHLDIRLLASWPAILLSHIILTLSKTSPCPIIILLSVQRGSDKCQFWNLLVWFDLEWNSRPSACTLPNSAALSVCRYKFSWRCQIAFTACIKGLGLVSLLGFNPNIFNSCTEISR